MVQTPSEGPRTPNRLIHEKSPYLLQHAYNPVDWHPWGEEAFARARTGNKPIFLSIGYSTCYWCHVMEREVFENRELAALMNAHFVNIKVDREERPDVDRIYMAALTAMTGSGGWPMSMFLTPDLKPFFGATYIPPVTMYGRAGFGDVVRRIHEVWTNERERILETGEQLSEYLRRLSGPDPSPDDPDPAVADTAFARLDRSFDSVHGGFGQAPKFPRPVAFTFLFRYSRRTGSPRALEIATHSLRRMACGGVVDQIGGGFHRYATDAEWHVPHFEKMLYDQAQLAISFLEAFQITSDAFFATIARDVLAYVHRELRHPDGGWYSAQDAESGIPDGNGARKEGAFYTWRWDELSTILNSNELEFASDYFGVRREGNVRSDPHGEFAGLNILHVTRPLGAGENELLSDIRTNLLAARARRPRPHLDDKILVSWNGLTISAFARASRILGEPAYRTQAEQSARFLLTTCRRNGTLLRRFRDGEARFDAHLEDYAFLIQGLLDLSEATFEPEWLEEAISLADEMIRTMYDDHDGGFFDTAGSDPSLLVRTKEFYDSAEPSGNSVAILVLLRLAAVTGKAAYEERARKSLRFFTGRLRQAPDAMPQFLAALEFASFGMKKPRQIILTGDPGTEAVQQLTAAIFSRFLPDSVIIGVNERNRKRIEALIPWAGMARGTEPAAYVCEDFTCKLPTSDPKILAGMLDEGLVR